MTPIDHKKVLKRVYLRQVLRYDLGEQRYKDEWVDDPACKCARCKLRLEGKVLNVGAADA